MPNSEIMEIRRRVLYSALAWVDNGKNTQNRLQLAKEIIPKGAARWRCCIHKERAVVEERLGVIFEPNDGPVVRVLKEACNGCEMHRYVVTDRCQNCVGHFCASNCPKKAILFVNNRAFINQNICVECGLCARNCPYGAILELHRPCEENCPTKAITVQEDGIAAINQSHCVSCGKCVAYCPFGAVTDICQLVDLYQEIRKGDHSVDAILAPAFVGQFGRKVTPGQVKSALLKLGFANVYEAATGADMAIRSEAKEYHERLAEGEPFMTSSCCPAYVQAVKQERPELAKYISETPSPMVQVARMIKRNNPDTKIAFIGPCIAKKAEARQPGSDVDYVITFEELVVWLDFAGIDLTTMKEIPFEGPSSHAREFAKAGGVARALTAYLGKQAPPTYRAEGINNCLKTVEQLVKDQAEGFFEGMACEGGCVGGPRTLVSRPVAERAVSQFALTSTSKNVEIELTGR